MAFPSHLGQVGQLHWQQVLPHLDKWRQHCTEQPHGFQAVLPICEHTAWTEVKGELVGLGEPACGVSLGCAHGWCWVVKWSSGPAGLEGGGEAWDSIRELSAGEGLRGSWDGGGSKGSVNWRRPQVLSRGGSITVKKLLLQVGAECTRPSKKPGAGWEQGDCLSGIQVLGEQQCAELCTS